MCKQPRGQRCNHVARLRGTFDPWQEAENQNSQGRRLVIGGTLAGAYILGYGKPDVKRGQKIEPPLP